MVVNSRCKWLASKAGCNKGDFLKTKWQKNGGSTADFFFILHGNAEIGNEIIRKVTKIRWFFTFFSNLLAAYFLFFFTYWMDVQKDVGVPRHAS